MIEEEIHSFFAELWKKLVKQDNRWTRSPARVVYDKENNKFKKDEIASRKKKLEQIKEKFSSNINDIAYIPLKKTLKTEIISLGDLDTYNTNEILKKKPKTINFKIFKYQVNFLHKTKIFS